MSTGIEDIRKWKDILISRTNTVKKAILPKLLYRVNAVPFKIPIAYVRTRENSPKIHMEPKET